MGIIIAGTEAGEAGVVVVEAACKTKGLEAGVAVLGDLSPDIIVDPLDHTAILGVNDQVGTAQMIAEDAVGEAVFDQIIGRVAASSSRTTQCQDPTLSAQPYAVGECSESGVVVYWCLGDTAAMQNHTIRAIFDDKIIRVYQAYRPEIAEPALAAGRFLPPFKMGRMTWIKPSFNWMMYRSGFASKPGQEFVLGIDITRDGFEWTLANAALSGFTPGVHASHKTWKLEVQSKPVRIQWDPERDWRLHQIQGVQAIQIGLSGEAVERYVRDWIVRIEDVTPIARVAASAATAADLPCLMERPYPLSSELASMYFD